MSSQITGGFISVEDGLKKAEDYAPPRKVRVELTFSVAEGEGYDAIFDVASQAASNRVHALLHGIAIATVHPSALGTSVSSGVQSAETAPATRVRRTKVQIEADKAAENPTDADAVVDDTAAIVEDTPSVEDPFVVQPEPDPAAVTEDLTSSGPADAVITDADLNSAVQKKNQELQDPALIRSVIAAYNPDPTKVFQLREIPAAKRAEFLAKLKDLKKSA